MSRNRTTPLDVRGASSIAWRAAIALLVAACGTQHIDLARDPLGGGRDAGKVEAGSIPDAAPRTDASPTMDGSTPARDATLPLGDAAPAARCGAVACACDDGLDNDGDGRIDGLDPECTGALDED
jgi:hypothetical protein